MSDKYEYKELTMFQPIGNNVNQLKELGEEGWKLVFVKDEINKFPIMIFIRKKKE